MACSEGALKVIKHRIGGRTYRSEGLEFRTQGAVEVHGYPTIRAFPVGGLDLRPFGEEIIAHGTVHADARPSRYAFLCRDDQHTIGGLQAIEGGSAGAFQHGNGFDIGRVDIKPPVGKSELVVAGGLVAIGAGAGYYGSNIGVVIDRDPIDDDEGLVVRTGTEGRDAADNDIRTRAGRTAGGSDIDIIDLALQRADKIILPALGQLGSAYFLDAVTEDLFLLPDPEGSRHDHFVQGARFSQ